MAFACPADPRDQFGSALVFDIRDVIAGVAELKWCFEVATPLPKFGNRIGRKWFRSRFQQLSRRWPLCIGFYSCDFPPITARDRDWIVEVCFIVIAQGAQI